MNIEYAPAGVADAAAYAIDFHGFFPLAVFLNIENAPSALTVNRLVGFSTTLITFDTRLRKSAYLMPGISLSLSNGNVAYGVDIEPAPIVLTTCDANGTPKRPANVPNATVPTFSLERLVLTADCGAKLEAAIFCSVFRLLN